MICLEFFYRLTSDWQDLGRPSTGQWDMDAKKGCEKFLLCPIDSSSKLFAPSNKCLYSFLWLSEETDPFFGATPYHQNESSRWAQYDHS